MSQLFNHFSLPAPSAAFAQAVEVMLALRFVTHGGVGGGERESECQLLVAVRLVHDHSSHLEFTSTMVRTDKCKRGGHLTSRNVWSVEWSHIV